MLDFSPSAGGAAPWRQLVAHARVQALAMVRNPEQLAVIWLFPLLLLGIGCYATSALDLELSTVVASAVGLAIFSTSFTAVALTTEHRVGERLAATPLGRTGLVLGTGLAIWLIIATQLAPIFLVATWCGWRASFASVGWLAASCAAALATAAFTALGLLVAKLRRLWVRLATTIAVFLGGAFLGGLVFPIASYPEWVQPLLWLLPTGAFGEALRQGSWQGVLVLLGWCWLSLLIARRSIRWLP